MYSNYLVAITIWQPSGCVKPLPADRCRHGGHRGGHGRTGVADPGPATLSEHTRLAGRRFVTTGDHFYEVGAADATYPATGWHIRGEMGGFWTPPIKLLDGLWFGVNGQWLKATTYTSGQGYVRMDLAGPRGLRVRRVDVAPDGGRAGPVGLDPPVGVAGPAVRDHAPRWCGSRRLDTAGPRCSGPSWAETAVPRRCRRRAATRTSAPYAIRGSRRTPTAPRSARFRSSPGLRRVGGGGCRGVRLGQLGVAEVDPYSSGTSSVLRSAAVWSARRCTYEEPSSASRGRACTSSPRASPGTARWSFQPGR